MKLPITDPLAETLGIYVDEVAPEYAVLRTDSTTAQYNAFGFAHGGFLYTLGHIAARNMGVLCLNRHMQVVQANSLYLRKVFGSPITARASLLTDYGHTVVCLVEIMDAKGEICFRQTLTMQETMRDRVTLSEPKQPPVADGWHDRTAAFDRRKQEAPYFDEICHITAPEQNGDMVICRTDLYADTVSDAGYVHQGVLYTCSDNCAAACVAMLQKKQPITITSTVNYLAPATIGPVTAVGRVIREGRDQSFYCIDVYDGFGKPIVTSQFVMQCVPFAGPMPV